ncbi:protein kinase domain-containing protein [Roseofilum sp. Belize Diploria]|uniref:protein kinase domain-containing protein n=1 Tax=Roseofilum sp. Belize Diploria TaxID=2821501 RepID=UPI001AFD204B|nr:AAA family ATPase [Roseofilum sp. Belize Diploria]MBP0011260.1 AAA family ATPase [Roseofilum sp. Belize Diploria]
MVALTGYENLILIHDSENSQVYRARRISDRQPVIIKVLNRDYPTSEQIRRYKQEYQLINQLASPKIVKAYSLEKWQRSLAMVLEDFGAISLKQWLQERSGVSLEEFLWLSIAITESLGQIHAKHIIHKDINPANIVLNTETKEVKIIDFGISTQLSRENPTLKNPNVLEGTLAYISPEQTGRMNRSLDYHTDFYSLGVTFYELLTGKLPFIVEDALELIHCHIAKMPILAVTSENRRPIPQVLADIVLKLMAKNAEERYQSAEGLRSDLEECRQQLEASGKIAPFPLAQKDIAARFQIPQKLYGREAETATLLEAFERVAETGKVELMLVAGYSGIGKSSLVQELYKPITAHRGYFIAGKFDQFQRNIPYSAIVAAFGSLVEQLLGETEARLQVWQEKILKALGNNGQVIIDVIPEVELIVGKQPSIPTLGANKAQNRFNLVFGNFIHVFCDKEHPLTLFLDDLQWADLATLQLMERMLLEGQTEYLLLLGAYRDNEISAGHPLAISLAKLRQNKSEEIAQVTLNPLPLDQIAALIGDTLQQTSQAVSDLAQLTLEKTGGNPFFVNEFLQALHDEDLLQFNRQARSWQWDMAAIAARGFTDNVVELMVEKLQKLTPSSQEILALAACCGAEFDLELLTWVCEISPQETFELLQIALDRGFILPLSELDENLLIKSYKFGHDRIQQAAYALIPDPKKESLHYHIGRTLLQNIPPEDREENIFELVGQFNDATALITEQKERDELAELNLVACRKAKDANAYQAASEYANTGLLLLSETGWQRQYEMTLAFHELAAQLASLCGDLEAMEAFIEIVIARANKILEKVKVYRIAIVSKVSQNKLKEAITIARQLLQQLGVTFPENPTENDIQKALTEIGEIIGRRKTEDLVNLPIMSDREKIAIMEVINSIISAAHISSPLLLPLLIALSVKLSIQYGNTSTSAYAYAYYGALSCIRLQDVDTGVKLGQLALQIVSKLDEKVITAKVLCIIVFSVLHRKFHTKQTLSLMQEAYVSASEFGQLEDIGYAAHNFCLNAFWCGQSLNTLNHEASAYCLTLAQLNQSITANYCRIHWQTILNLLGFAENPSILSGEAFQEVEFVPRLISTHDLLGLFMLYLYKLMLCYLFEEIELAQSTVHEVKRYLIASSGTVGEPAFLFYASLTAIAALNSESEEERLEGLQQVEQNQTELQQQWAHYAPMNYQHKVDLVEAEKCRILGKKAEAIELYNKAISGAKENEYIQEEALANELAAKFYLDWGQAIAARAHIMEAHYCYSHWGATAKVKHLEQMEVSYADTLWGASTQVNRLNHRYSTLFTALPKQDSGFSEIQTQTSSEKNLHKTLDIETVFKANQIISGEIVLDKLLVELMKIILQNAGAQTGCLMMADRGSLVIQASGNINSEEIKVLQEFPVEESTLVCHAIVNYVARTQESVVLNDASHSGTFTQDSYIQIHQPQSILCVPLVNQGHLISIVYLENNLTIGAFTDERVNIVQVISGQAAIALENAYLYRNLEQKVAERTAELALANAEIKTLNEQLTSENLRLSSELDVAKKIQQMVLPKITELEHIEDLEIAGYMEPADEVGGDYYDILNEGDRIKISIGDVTGHGLESGVLMLMAQTVVRTLQNMHETNAIHFLEIVNQTLCQNLERMNSDKNMSLAILNYQKGLIKLSGQHEEIIVVRANGELELIDTLDLGFPMGLDWHISDFIHEQELLLNPNDVLILYTDGITEAENVDNQQYGLERLTQLAQQHGQHSAYQIRDRIIEDVREFIGEQKVFDDITLVVLKQR